MADSLTIDQLAKQFFVSKYHLMHEFSQKTGTSVYRYLMQQWLHAVCELLEQGTVPICCAASRIMQTSIGRSAAHTGRAPGNMLGPTGKRRRNPRHQMHRKIPSEISDSTVRALRGFCVSRNGDQLSIIPFSSFGIGSAIRRSTRENARPRPVQPTSR